MCNLYSLNKKRDAVARFFRVSHNRAAASSRCSAILPGHMAPIIKQSEEPSANSWSVAGDSS